MPRLAQLVEHLTVVVKKHVSADIRVSPVQVRERGPILGMVRVVDFSSLFLSSEAVNFEIKLLHQNAVTGDVNSHKFVIDNIK